MAEGVNKATNMVHWPGREVAACDEHLKQLLGLAEVMGFQLNYSPCAETICANCERKLRMTVLREGK